jgi:hypothetical protein
MSKITFIGAGSTVFVKNVLGDVMTTPALQGFELALFDIDAERLQDSERLLNSIKNTLGSTCSIKAYSDRKEALSGAKYVINAIQVGGYDPCTITDFEIPKKYGLRQTIADTLGIGGIFRNLRTIPVMLDFAKDMQEVCPDALFLNYTNPMAVLTNVMNTVGGINTVGLCHSVQVCVPHLFESLGMDPTGVESKIAAPKKTISIDGDLSDWQDVIPVTMVSNGSKDYLEAIMDPSRAKDILDHPDSFENVIYKARTAWDDNYFYFEAEVPDQVQFSNKPFDQDPYAFPFNADSVQLGFDTMKVNPDDLLYGDPYYEKAAVDVMDYLFVGTLAKGGIPELHRQMAPGTNKQTYYPTNADLNPRLGPMDVGPDGGKEGKMKVVRDDANKLTVYEIAVSWAAVPDLKQKLAKLDPHQVHEGHFSFAINDAGTDGKGMSTWNKETGQVQSGAYSFAPFWGTGQKDRGGSLVPRWGFKNEPASRMNGNS